MWKYEVGCIGLAVLLSLVLSAVDCRQVAAGMNSNHKVAIHLLAHEARSCVKNFPTIVYCSDIVTTYEGCGDVDAFPIFFGLTGYRGIAFGLTWPTAWGSCSWTRCAGDVNIGNIVNPGDGTTISWYSCQYDEPLVVGYAWVTASTSGSIYPCPDPTIRFIGAADCEHVEDPPAAIFGSGVCGAIGDDPCSGSASQLGIRKDDGLGGSCVLPGSEITYTIAYDNCANPHDVHNVVLKDSLPPELVFVSATGGGVYDVNTHTVEWLIGTVASGEADSEQMVAQVLPGTPAVTLITNVAVVLCDEAPSNRDPEYTWACPDEFSPLYIAKWDGHGDGCVAPGEVFTYDFYYHNDDNPVRVTGVTVVDQLPPEVNFMSADNGGAYDGVAHTITWEIGNLNTGHSGNLQAVVEMDPGAALGTTVTNSVQISSNETPASEATELTKVCPAGNTPFDIAITSDVVDCIVRETDITYDISFGNPSSNPEANSVELTAWYSSYGNLVSAPGGTHDPVRRKVVWPIGSLAPGETDSRTMVLRVFHGLGYLTTAVTIVSDEIPSASDEVRDLICGSVANPDHKIAIHIVAHEDRTCSDNFPVVEFCYDIQTTYPGCGEIDFFPVFYDLNAVISVEFGLAWPSDWGSCHYVACAGDTRVGDIVESGDGMGAAWVECHEAPLIVMGFGRITADVPGTICVTRNPLTGCWGVEGCDYETHDPPAATFCSGACGEPGEDLFGTSNTVPTTWGTIKAMFR